MKRSLVVFTSTGVVTSLEWWRTMKVEGESLLLVTASPDGEREIVLLVAQLRSEGEAQAMFRAIEQRIRLGAPRFDARDEETLVSENVAYERSRHVQERSKDGP